MRNRALHDALRDFALEAAALLTEDTRRGAELPFDVTEEPGSGAVLYRYRPLTSEFIEARWERLRELSSARPAAGALGSGAAAYLRVQGAEGPDAEPALRAMLDRLYEDAHEFDFPEERFERVYAEVERTLLEGSQRMTVVVGVSGLQLENAHVPVGNGLMLARGDSVDAPAEAVWPEGDRGEPAHLVVFESDVSPDEEFPLSDVRVIFRQLLTAMRLFKPGALALSPVAWVRADSGQWRPFALGPGGRARGDDWLLSGAESGQLRDFIEVVASARNGGATAWALGRFEMGCERGLDTEALSDYLLALGALLDASDEAGHAGLSMRAAALCAEPQERKMAQRRIDLAYQLEHQVVGGDPATIEAESPRTIVAHLEDCVRALLRDVMCGYLDPGLRAVADDMLLNTGEPFEIRAADLRVAEPEPEPEPEPETSDFRLPTSELQDDPGVTPSEEWGFDEEAESYSAPV